MNKILSCSFVLLFFTACGSSESDRQEQLNNELAKFKSAGALALYTFNGTYSSDCIGINAGGVRLYQKETLFFDDILNRTRNYPSPNSMGSSYSYTEHSSLFSDRDCRDAIADEDAQGEHRFESNGLQIIFKPKKYQMIPRSNRGAEALNQAKLCGDTNWKENQSKEISEKSCFSQYATQYAYLNLLDDDAKKVEVYFCKGAADLPSECIRVPMHR